MHSSWIDRARIISRGTEQNSKGVVHDDNAENKDWLALVDREIFAKWREWDSINTERSVEQHLTIFKNEHAAVQQEHTVIR